MQSPPEGIKLNRARLLFLVIFGLLFAGAWASYLILLNPGSILVRWAEAAFPDRTTVISFGPYPTAPELHRFKASGGRYIVSLVDPRLPYERPLLKCEQVEAKRNSLTLKDFPIASILGHRVLHGYRDEQKKAVKFLKRLDSPAYVHGYLGKCLVADIRDALDRKGVPVRLWTSESTKAQHCDLIRRLGLANQELAAENSASALEILQPVTIPGVDVSALRGWSNYRLGLYV